MPIGEFAPVVRELVELPGVLNGQEMQLTCDDDDLVFYSPMQQYQLMTFGLCQNVSLHTHWLPKSPATVLTPGMPSKLVDSGIGSESSLLNPVDSTFGIAVGILMLFFVS
jgi:hypothetical protein